MTSSKRENPKEPAKGAHGHGRLPVRSKSGCIPFLRAQRAFSVFVSRAILWQVLHPDCQSCGHWHSFDCDGKLTVYKHAGHISGFVPTGPLQSGFFNS